jgi:hypothetical protein
MKKLITLVFLLMASATGAFAQFTPPGTRSVMWDWHGVGDGNLPKTVGYFFTEDTVAMTVEEGDFGDPNKMKLVLQAGPGISWRKEMVFLNACNGARVKIFTEGSKTSDEMTVTKSGCNDTIFFRKAKLFAGNVDMYHMDPPFFWKIWGGKKVTIRWTADGWGAGNPNPPNCSYPCIPFGTNPLGGIVYDGDNKADIALFHPLGGLWLSVNSSTSIARMVPFGDVGDTPVPMDYDHDGMPDAAVFRITGTQGQFLILNSFSGTTRIVNFGVAGDIPVPGDYDADGRVDVAVWQPMGASSWRIKLSSTGSTQSVNIGVSGDIPVPGDYDGNHFADAAVFQPSTGTWSMNTGAGGAIISQHWGMNGDLPVPGDYDGDGKTDLAVWRPSDRTWYIHKSSDGSTYTLQWGLVGDRLVQNDYDGDGRTDIAIWRPSTSEWYVNKSSDGGLLYTNSGSASDLPVPKK